MSTHRVFKLHGASFADNTRQGTTSALRAAHDRISHAMMSEGLGFPVCLCYVDTQKGCVVVGVDNTAPELLRGYRRMKQLAGGAPVRAFHAVPAVRHTNKRDHNRPLVGGLYIACPAVSGEGTVCIGASRDGAAGFVTCGHVVERVGIDVFQPRQSTARDRLVGRSTVVSNYAGNAASDSAFVTLAHGVAADRTIWKSSSTTYTAIGIYDAPEPGTAVSMQGASTQTTLRTGDICAKNVTVTFSDGGVLSDQLLANYVSVTGDSGAPVFYPLDGTSVLLVGLNVGAALPADTHPQPVGRPTAPNGTYAVISPWRNVESDLELTLGLLARLP
jgi:hypothetical protein